MLRKAILILTAALFVALIWQWELIYYGYKQGVGQLSIIYNAEPIDHYLDDGSYPDSLKHKLKLIQEVRQFTYDHLNFNSTYNYTSMFDQKGQPLMWVVTACDPFSFKPKLWRFPIVGEVPYKGYFDKEMAKEELEKLKKEGYDVGVRNPGGWSTLGWFTDPILSEMLNRSDEQLIELIIHELSHSTIFIKDRIVLNENLASFIAFHGTQYFLKNKFKEDNSNLNSYLKEEEDYNKLVEHFINGAKSLNCLYETFEEENLNIDLKQKAKEELINEIIQNLDSIQFNDVNRFKFNFEEIPNNTYFMSYLRYRSMQYEFEEMLKVKFNNDIVRFVNYYKEEYPFLE